MLKNIFKFELNQINLIDYLILFVTLFFTLYYGFGSYALENMNEGLYGEIPREMMLMGNYIVPHLNFVPYLEKPPMLYWLIAASYHIFGINAFAARLIPVTAGALTCLAVFFFAKKIQYARVGWLAAMILASSAGFILISRVIIFDMVLTLLFCSSLFFFYLWYEQEKRYYLWFCYGFMGLAFMTKGLLSVALVPFIAILFMLLNKTPWQKIFKFIDIVGILIFFAIVIPWVIAATLKQPGFAYDFFINEQVMRFLNKRIPHDYHTGPFYYNVFPLIVILLPWTLLVPFLFKKSKNITHTPDDKKASLKKFLWTWFITVFIFFSISQAKAQYYIIIGIPALALLLALRINESLQDPKSRLLSRTFKVLIVFVVVVLGLIALALHTPAIYDQLPENLQQPTDYAFPLFIMLITMSVYGLIAIIINKITDHKPIIQFISIAWLIIPWIFFLVHDKHRLEPNRSEIFLAQYMLTHAPERPVYLYRDYENFSSILYYVQKRLPIIDSASKDLYYGSSTPAAKGWFLSAAEFAPLAQHQSVYVVSFDDRAVTFIKIMAPQKFCQVAQSGDVVVLTNDKTECHT